jgi:hypothetical protein
MYEILTEKIYEKYSTPERAKVYHAWYRTAKCKCECGRVVNLNNIRRHEKQAPHLAYLEKKAC